MKSAYSGFVIIRIAEGAENADYTENAIVSPVSPFARDRDRNKKSLNSAFSVSSA